MFLKLNNNPKLKGFRAIRQLEYLESSGTQWIDTGFIPNRNSRYVITFKYATLPNTWSSVMSGRDGNTNTANAFGVYINQSNCARISTGKDDGLTINNPILTNTLYTIDANIKTGIVSYNNIGYTEGPYNRDGTKSLYLFAANDNGSASFKASVRIYSIKLYSNDTLIHDFVPVLDDNNIPCMYDTVSEVFFYNQGTGDFIAGPIAGIVTDYVVDSVVINVDKLFIKNCPLCDGYSNLKKIYDVQSDNNSVILSRIRVDIGNVSGSLSELLQYAGMTGFNDAGEEQAKPRLVGTWTVNDWHTQEQITTAQAAFDGLTVVPDPNYLINFDDLAVQVLDSTKPNYNPAVAIILQSNNVGTTLSEALVNGGGRWFLSKTDAANIISNSQYSPFITYFRNKTSVIDSNGIVSNDNSITYKFTSFNEFKWFTGVSYISDLFNRCSELSTVVLPNTITNLLGSSSNGGTFYSCSKLTEVNIPSNLQILGNYIFMDCSMLNIGLEFPPTITTFLARCFDNSSISYIHISNETPFTINTGNYGSFVSYNNKIYVGDGSSAAHDDAILQAYLADTSWATVSSQLDTWYNYLHPTT